MDRNVNKEGVLSGLPDPKIIKKIGNSKCQEVKIYKNQIRTINNNFIKIFFTYDCV